MKNKTINNPLVSIITIVYNCETYLARAIESIINQTYSNIEYIIIDGGSTDNSVNIIKSYKSRINFWMSEPDNGISDAFNKGIKKSLLYSIFTSCSPFSISKYILP